MELQEPIVDLAVSTPRSARERLDGITILARAVDKARAELADKLGDYVYWKCGINDVLFSTLDVSADAFLEMVRDAAAKDAEGRRDYVRDVYESLEAPATLSEQQMFEHLTRAQIDNAMVAWIRDVLRTPREQLDAMNVTIENMEPQTPEQHAYFDAELATIEGRPRNIATYVDLLDRQESPLVHTPRGFFTLSVIYRKPYRPGITIFPVTFCVAIRGRQIRGNGDSLTGTRIVGDHAAGDRAAEILRPKLFPGGRSKT